VGEKNQFLINPKPSSSLAQPPENRSGTEEIQLMYDLMFAALQTDSTRVLTYRLPIASLLTSLGIKVAAHDMSHYSPGERMEASQKRDATHAELSDRKSLFARFPQPGRAVSSRGALKGELLLRVRNMGLFRHFPQAFRAETQELLL
jgi:hypothetical protein